jgi:DNA polymerase-3 subunit gamma/tau
VGRLALIAEEEGFKADPVALEYIARQGGGSMRDAISLLDQMIAYGGDAITVELVQNVLGAVASQSVVALVEALIQRDTAAGLDVINRVVGDGIDPRQFAREIVEYLRSVMLAKLAQSTASLNLPDDTLAAIRRQAAQIDTGAVVQAVSRFNQAQIDIKSGLLAIPQLPLELAFVEAVTPVTVVAAPPVAVAPPARPAAAPPSQEASAPRPAERPAAPPPSAETPAPPPSGRLTTALVQQRLPQVVTLIEPRSKTMSEALRNARLHRVVGNEIQMITFDLLKKKFDQPEPRKALIEAFSQILGEPVVIKFYTEGDVPTSDAANAPSSAEQAAANSGTEALLKMATEELGGQVVD